MTQSTLPQVDADGLIAMEKLCSDDSQFFYPEPGSKLVVPLASSDGKESFLLDITRGKINLTKVSHQNRAKHIIVLIRLDINGAPHRNPDGEEIPCPHLHIYQEGFGDKWAISLPADLYRNTDDLSILLEDFMNHCNITGKPRIQFGLF